jgi:hypothetical protein
MKRLKKKHREVVYNFYEHFKHISNISQGGCGIFAKYLYLKFIILGYKPEIILHLSKDSVKNHQEVFERLIATYGQKLYSQDFKKEFLNWFHVSVRVGGTCYDSNGVYAPYEDKRYLVISYTTLVTMLSIRFNWYHKFDRTKEAPKIKRVIDRIFI